MAAVQIKIDQLGKPAGTAGVAREDLATGVKVTATAVGAGYSAYKWELIDAPPEWVGPSLSAAACSAPTMAVTDVLPIDNPGTYLLRVSVNSGSGLGATPDDVAEITWYAGPSLAGLPYALPRRRPAFFESLHHNVRELALYPGGNPKGWKLEMDRWFEVIEKLYATVAAVVSGPPAVLEEQAATIDGQTVFDVAGTIAVGALTTTEFIVNGQVMSSASYAASNIAGHGRVTYVPSGDSPIIRAGWRIAIRYQH